MEENYSGKMATETTQWLYNWCITHENSTWILLKYLKGTDWQTFASLGWCSYLEDSYLYFPMLTDYNNTYM